MSAAPLNTKPVAPLRIFVLAHALQAAGGLNVGLNLIDAMIRMGPEHNYGFTIPEDLGYEAICDQAPHHDVHVYAPRNSLRRLLYDKFTLPRIVHRFQPDVVLALGNLGLLRPPSPQAVFVHQPHLLYPEKHYGPQTLRNKLRLRYIKRRFARQLSRTQLLFCQTDVVAARLRTETGFTGTLSVCGTSISASLLNSACGLVEPEPLKRHTGKFKLLYLTRYYPHKNIEGIVDTFIQFKEQLSDVVVFLTIAPEQHPNAAQVLQNIARAGLEKNIVNLGPMPHTEVADYYGHCDGLLMPTLLETFGIPYLEAMSTGIPIITSDLDFAHEVCGSAALYCNPWSKESLRDAIIQLKEDGELRRTLVENGRKNVARDIPSWDDIAGSVLSGVKDIVDAGRLSA